MSSTLPGTTSEKKRQAPRLSLRGINYQDYGLVGVVISGRRCALLQRQRVYGRGRYGGAESQRCRKHGRNCQ